MSEDNRSDSCPTGKVRYATEEDAAVALDRVQAARAVSPDGRCPERAWYECSNPACGGWHLTSRSPDLPPEEEPRGDGETWEAYAHRLERRIKSQRDHLALLRARDEEAGKLRDALRELRTLVDEQAEDDGLWPIYPRGEQRITEAYLQQELRRLHAAVESRTDARAVLPAADQAER